MKTFAYAGFLATVSEGHRASALLRKLRQALRRFRNTPRRRPRLGSRYEDFTRLDRRVLEEIGLTREQIIDASQPVWWQ